MGLNIVQEAAEALLTLSPLNKGAAQVEVDLARNVAVLSLYGAPLVIYRQEAKSLGILAAVQTFTSRTFVNAVLDKAGVAAEDRIELARKGRKWTFRGELVPTTLEVGV